MNIKTISKQKKAGKSTTMTVRLTPALNDKLNALAKDTKRSKAFLANEALISYVEQNAWQIAHITASLEEAKSGAPGIPHEDMESWVESWDTKKEIPAPQPRSLK